MKVYGPTRSSRKVLTSVGAAVFVAIHGAAAFADGDTLTEVVVTATRHAVSAQDVPQSITAVSGDTLAAAGIQDLAGLAHAVAGVNYVDKGPYGGISGSTLVIRGLNSENTSALAFPSQLVSPVALYVDETPLFANIRLLDIDHVEILRGPQGTLYGSGSLGGTIRVVQNAPDPKAFDARIEVGASDTDHSHSPNEDLTGVLNLPVTDTFAVRLNAGFTNQAGFINQPDMYRLGPGFQPLPQTAGDLFSPPQTYDQTGTNSYGYRNARLATLWQPLDSLKVQLSYYYQISNGNGYPYAAPIYGLDNLESPDHFRETTRDQVNLVPLTVEYDMGFATLTSASAWGHHTNHTIDDGTSPYEDLPGYVSYYGSNPRAMFPRQAHYDDTRYTEELRLVSRTGGMFEWVTGVFFNSQHTNVSDHDFYPGYNAFYNACVPQYGAGSTQCGAGEYGPETGTTSIDGIPLTLDETAVADYENKFQDVAGFAEVTWNATHQLSFTGGVRVFSQSLTHAEQTGLNFDGPDYMANNTASDSWRKAIWKVSATYRFDEHNLVYATRSEGFRPGSANALPVAEPFANYVTPAALTIVQPDTADNYEIGFKGTLNHRVQYSAAIYDVEWKNIQQSASLTPMELGGAVNVGDGYSRGVESELNAQVTEHVNVRLGYTYDTTKLTSISALALANLTSPPKLGSQLPGTPKDNASLTLEYGHIEVAGGELRFSVDGHYQSAVLSSISVDSPVAAGYSMFDARVGYTRDQWMASLYVDNFTNQLGISSYTDPAEYANRYSAIVSRPRTIGMTVGYSLKGY